MARIDEIAPDLYRVSIYVPQFDLQFNHFLIKDDEPLLFHTGMRRMFPEVRDAIAKADRPGRAALDQLEPFRGGRVRRAERVARGRASRAGDLQPGGRRRQHRGLRRSPAARPHEGRRDRDRPAPVPVRADAAPAARLGRRRAVRGEIGRAPVLRPVPSDRRRRTGHVRGRAGPVGCRRSRPTRRIRC